MTHIKTCKNPSHCPKCLSNNIDLFEKHFKKDKNGKDTNIPIIGMWMCNECGDIIGRRINEFQNELDENSL